LLACTAQAAGPARPLDGFFKDVARQTGKTEERVREDAVETLRKEGKVSESDLERIGRGELDALEPARHDELLNLLKNSEGFKERTGLAALTVAKIAKEAGEAFDAMKVKEIELPKTLQSRWVDAIFAQSRAPKSVFAALEVTFELRVSAREFPPYGDTYTGLFMLDGKRVRVRDNDLLAATAVELLKTVHRGNPGVVIRGRMTAERIAKEAPPYGFDQVLTLTLE
jgi:hypothetical protein